MSAATQDALRAEERRLRAIPEIQDRAVAVSDFFAAIDQELASIAYVRAHAVRALSRGGMSQRAIADAVGLSKARVAQLLHDPRFP